MRILYSGPLRPWSLTEGRLRALAALGHDVVPLDETGFLERGPIVWQKFQRHLLMGPGADRYNRALTALARSVRPDLIWIDQGGQIRPDTVAELRATGARLLHHTTDSFWHRTYWFRHYFKAIELYDIHVVTNELNRPFLEKRGARCVILDEFAYDPERHRPPSLTSDERRRHAAEAIFVGHWEPPTERMVVALRSAGINVRVCGPHWWRARTMGDRRTIGPVHGAEYIGALAGARLCLGFLSKANQNQSAVRTFEIPAVGGFLLAERTADHQRYFAESTEAEYFDSPDELVDKARFYLRHSEARDAVAAAGHRRCTTSPYTWADRCRRILEAVH